MQIKGAEAFLDYPETMQEGSVLHDGKLHMDIENNGSAFGTIDVSISERKVSAKEEVTSPAGSWNCFKISTVSVVKSKEMGIGFPIQVQVAECFAPGFGVVKTESFSKSGKLMGSSLVTSVK